MYNIYSLISYPLFHLIDRMSFGWFSSARWPVPQDCGGMRTPRSRNPKRRPSPSCRIRPKMTPRCPARCVCGGNWSVSLFSGPTLAPPGPDRFFLGATVFVSFVFAPSVCAYLLLVFDPPIQVLKFFIPWWGLDRGGEKEGAWLFGPICASLRRLDWWRIRECLIYAKHLW